MPKHVTFLFFQVWSEMGVKKGEEEERGGGGVALVRWPRNSLSGVKQSCGISVLEEPGVDARKKKKENYAKLALYFSQLPIKF